MKKVAYVGGYWSPNIGNGFFNMGADYVLKQVFGEENVSIVFDQPAYITFHDRRKGNPKKAFEHIKYLDVDYIVLLGPVISRAFLAIWKDTLIELNKRNVKYMILSAGMMKYTREDLDKCKEFFKEYPPYVLTTRDSITYNEFKDYATHSYDGVCFAFFLPEAYRPIKLNINQKILTLNFDKIFEPKILFNYQKEESNFSFDGKDWLLKFNKFVKKIGGKTDRLSDMFVYFMSLFPGRKKERYIDDYFVIRTDHRFTPMLMNKVYRHLNSFAGDLPHTYLDIYANSFITLSDRVHACAATLAFGNYAMFFSKTNRSALLDRVGARNISKEPVKIDLEYLKNEKIKLLEWMKKINY